MYMLSTTCPHCSHTETGMSALPGTHPPGVVHKGGGAHSLCNLLPALQHQVSNGNCFLEHPTCTPKEDASQRTVQDWGWLAPATSDASIFISVMPRNTLSQIASRVHMGCIHHFFQISCYWPCLCHTEKRRDQTDPGSSLRATTRSHRASAGSSMQQQPQHMVQWRKGYLGCCAGQ